VKWALIHEHDPRGQIAAINALLMLHHVVIEHRTMRLFGLTLAEIEEAPGVGWKKLRLVRPAPGCQRYTRPCEIPEQVNCD